MASDLLKVCLAQRSACKTDEALLMVDVDQIAADSSLSFLEGDIKQSIFGISVFTSGAWEPQLCKPSLARTAPASASLFLISMMCLWVKTTHDPGHVSQLTTKEEIGERGDGRFK